MHYIHLQYGRGASDARLCAYLSAGNNNCISVVLTDLDVALSASAEHHLNKRCTEPPSEQTVHRAPSEQTVHRAPSEQTVHRAPAAQTDCVFVINKTSPYNDVQFHKNDYEELNPNISISSCNGRYFRIRVDIICESICIAESTATDDLSCLLFRILDNVIEVLIITSQNVEGDAKNIINIRSPDGAY